MPQNNNKKEIERQALHSAIWKTADNLRGAVNGFDFMQYVLGMLFYRFISENLVSYINEAERSSGDKSFDYASLSNKEAERARQTIIKEKGFFILPKALFANIRKTAANDANLNITLSKTFNSIEASAAGTESEEDIKGLFSGIDTDKNILGRTVQERNERLIKILNAIGDLELGDYQANSIDVFGDAYEFLITMYAANAGKSVGEFFTPQEVSELLAKITIGNKKNIDKVYDPACGSGSLLLKFAKILGKDNVKSGFFGQEINPSTYNLCRMNMFLHNINYDKFNILDGDTLTKPQHNDDGPFDAIVSNPPYAIH